MRRGREPSAKTLRARGVLAVVVAAVVIAVVAVNPFAGPDDRMRFSIVAPSVPDGIRVGVPVDVRGETVGEVCDVDLSRSDSTRIVACVNSSATGELTDDAVVSFVSRNLFGSDALRLTPSGTGSRVASGSVLTLKDPPSNYTITATVRSAGSFTLPVLTPELSDLLGQVSDTTTRLAPFLTAATVTMQTMQRGDVTRLTSMMPTIDDALNGASQAGGGAVGALVKIISNRLLQDSGYTGRVQNMIADIGGLFSDLGTLFNGMSGLGATMDLMTAFTTPLRYALRDVTPGQVGSLIDRFGGAFHTDRATGRTTLSVDVDLDVVPGAATPLRALIAGKGSRR
ncbi:MlaD family protein [Gordonia sp. HY442]|uniref:MlaD family protein n=1 Tax=Gordonia zhenghanii TaxID=2911516 RepID=UPI001F1DAB51|nr:MlaD family protein [Gordonia zhenghanii]MCF8603472.1 MlaD family protein [Gordonia zhenghanii]